jgi:hypothetical protein
MEHENENGTALAVHAILTQLAAFVYAIGAIRVDDATNVAEHHSAMAAIQQIAKICDGKVIEASRVLGEFEQDWSDLYNAKKESARWCDRKISEFELQLGDCRLERDNALMSRNEWRTKAITLARLDPDIIAKCTKQLNDQCHAAMANMTDLTIEQVQPIVALALGGEKINAIKYLRDAFPTHNTEPMSPKSHLGLREAKEMIEGLNLA